MNAFLAWLSSLKPTPTPPAVKAAAPASAKGAWLAIALTVVAGFEGLYTHAYKDSVGVTTICYGVTNYDRPVKMGDTKTVAQCKEMLSEDLPRYKKMVDRVIHVPMPPHRTAAMVSFVYNVGEGNLKKSSVARKINAGDWRGGCEALMLWNKAGGRVLKGLTNRREAERKMCLRSD